jgi:hypothetical protein
MIPETKPLLDQCQANLEQWRQIDEEIKKQKEEKKGLDTLSFLEKVLETSEEVLQEQAATNDMEDKIFSESLLEGEKEGQGTAGKNSIQEASPQHSELTHSVEHNPSSEAENHLPGQKITII